MLLSLIDPPLGGILLRELIGSLHRQWTDNDGTNWAGRLVGSQHILLVVPESRTMNEPRRLGSWTVLPHDGSKVAAPHDDILAG